MLEKLGHEVEPATIDLGARFVTDFVDYWGMLAATVATGGRFAFGRTLRRRRTRPVHPRPDRPLQARSFRAHRRSCAG